MPEKVRLIDAPGAGKCVTCDIMLCWCMFNTPMGEYAACPWWEPREEEKP